MNFLGFDSSIWFVIGATYGVMALIGIIAGIVAVIKHRRRRHIGEVFGERTITLRFIPGEGWTEVEE